MTLIMLGLSLSNDSLFCLGIMFILIGILFFYIKKQITHLETAQLEQAKLLQSIIMSLNSGQVMVPQNSGESIHETNMGEGIIKENSLIDVSDGEEDSGEEDSDDEDSDDEKSENSSESDNSIQDYEEIEDYNKNVEKTINDIDEDSVINISNNVKVISLSNTLEEPEEINIDNESLSDDDDEDDEDEDDDEDSVSLSATDGLAKPSLKTLKVGDLRKLVSDKGLHEDPSKIKKNELIELLEKQ